MRALRYTGKQENKGVEKERKRITRALRYTGKQENKGVEKERKRTVVENASFSGFGWLGRLPAGPGILLVFGGVVTSGSRKSESQASVGVPTLPWEHDTSPTEARLKTTVGGAYRRGGGHPPTQY
ncbi:hypothetical protein NDU88_007587 [Pleurodeles waltl]|uniref:Uncharacterized protein n=1 Tax=Pleurodeles waltl TaxID=8319 RepID=A0AAV7RPX1_PLEWA|nr:hypothetical protein NDU88_007587 [Pleurodeles waltl]